MNDSIPYLESNHHQQIIFQKMGHQKIRTPKKNIEAFLLRQAKSKIMRISFPIRGKIFIQIDANVNTGNGNFEQHL